VARFFQHFTQPPPARFGFRRTGGKGQRIIVLAGVERLEVQHAEEIERNQNGVTGESLKGQRRQALRRAIADPCFSSGCDPFSEPAGLPKSSFLHKFWHELCREQSPRQ
jgi:hypothetical protein